MMDQAIGVTTLAYQESYLGRKSQHGLMALFKNTINWGLLRSYLNDMSAMLPKKGLLPFRNIACSPRIACVTPDTAQDYEFFPPRAKPFAWCHGANNRFSFYQPDTIYIFLCPQFFDLPMVAAPHMHCPDVKNNMFDLDTMALVRFQTYVFSAQLARFYMQLRALTPATRPPEQLDLNGCIGLKGLDPVRNAPSIMAFIAMVDQDCTKEPDITMPPWTDKPGLLGTFNSTEVSNLSISANVGETE